MGTTIFHLGVIGAPTTWTVTAVYRDSLGIAYGAADAWYARTLVADGAQVEPSPGPGPRDCPQFICRIKDGVADWTRLWMGGHHLRSQNPDDRTGLIQWHTAPYEVPEDVAKAVERALHGAHVETGYVIPRAEWERRYPSQVLVSRLFAEFNAAYDAHKASGAEGRMPFEPRWTLFMETPCGYEFPYDAEKADDGHVVVRRDPDGSMHRLEGVWDEDEATRRCRLHNSGWTPDEVDIHMREEPLD